jgi:hypothetical protein
VKCGKIQRKQLSFEVHQAHFLRLKNLRISAVYVTVDGEMIIKCDGKFKKVSKARKNLSNADCSVHHSSISGAPLKL